MTVEKAKEQKCPHGILLSLICPKCHPELYGDIDCKDKNGTI